MNTKALSSLLNFQKLSHKQNSSSNTNQFNALHSSTESPSKLQKKICIPEDQSQCIEKTMKQEIKQGKKNLQQTVAKSKKLRKLFQNKDKILYEDSQSKIAQSTKQPILQFNLKPKSEIQTFIQNKSINKKESIQSISKITDHKQQENIQIKLIFKKNSSKGTLSLGDKLNALQKKEKNKLEDHFEKIIDFGQESDEEFDEQVARLKYKQKLRKQLFFATQYALFSQQKLPRTQTYYFKCTISIKMEFQKLTQLQYLSKKITFEQLKINILEYVNQRHLIRENDKKKASLEFKKINSKQKNFQEIQCLIKVIKINVKQDYKYRVQDGIKDKILGLKIYNEFGEIQYEGLCKQIFSIDFSQIEIKKNMIYPHSKAPYTMLNLPKTCKIIFKRPDLQSTDPNVGKSKRKVDQKKMESLLKKYQQCYIILNRCQQQGNLVLKLQLKEQ